MLIILDKYLQAIEKVLPANNRPPIVDNQEPLIKIEPIENRLFIRPSYFEQQIPNSLNAIYLRQQAAKQLLQALFVLPEEYSFILYE